MLVVARQVQLHLLALRFGLLQAQDIGVVRRHKAGKFALVYHRTNTVDVPGVEIHDVESFSVLVVVPPIS